MSDDSELVLRWVRAWARTRRLSVGTVDGCPIVRVGAASRATEIVCVDPGARRLAGLLEHVRGDDRAMLTVFARDVGHYVRAELPSGLRVDRDDETFMTTTLAAPEHHAPPPGLTDRWEHDGAASRLVVEQDGSPAAEGTVGLLGVDAVVDAVETLPAFRRTGLGRHVMSRLASYAASEGASTGLLAATAEGRRLYEALGWDATLAMWSVMGTREPR